MTYCYVDKTLSRSLCMDEDLCSSSLVARNTLHHFSGPPQTAFIIGDSFMSNLECLCKSLEHRSRRPATARQPQ
ncbi:hypothetical protein BAUCODRAFT_173695 [Baudoinia panamericana UAMH 10762]|uniref:Uncharacterized protein n=1 Tax=Baudoinia panamericana (strain UAMH 10762) TaxID=717646 RepID=M2M0N3_BAUPA|nr:uncharacterized protein BAUCODRAFT_173695 [Baudoinia panamericana UAMH 10762]EMD00558.1 hypothetical protein BAUCODRAFT_173695 [Baudoinia panamericana UAMH 10762]